MANKAVCSLKHKKDQRKLVFFMPRARVELATLASSGQRSTAELPRRILSFCEAVWTAARHRLVSLRLKLPRLNTDKDGIKSSDIHQDPS
jgi:hypothetical protein